MWSHKCGRGLGHLALSPMHFNCMRFGSTEGECDSLGRVGTSYPKLHYVKYMFVCRLNDGGAKEACWKLCSILCALDPSQLRTAGAYCGGGLGSSPYGEATHELEWRWSLAYPQWPSRAAALLRQLKHIKARQAQPQEVSPHWGVLFGILLYVRLQGPAGGPTLEAPDAPTEPDLSGPYGFLDAWRPKLEAFYQALLDSGWDGLYSRSRPSLRGRAVDSGLLAEIGDMLVDVWDSGPQLAKPAAKLWRLSCLMHSGAVLAVKAARHCAAAEAGGGG